MSKPALIVIIILVVLIIAFGTFYLVTRPTYGNDEAGIKKLIKENTGSESEPTVIGMQDKAGNRYVGYSQSNMLGLMVLVANSRGNYEFENVYWEYETNIVAYWEPFAVDVTGTHGVDIVVSRDPRLKKVARLIDGAVDEEMEVAEGEPTVVALSLDTEETALKVRIECYDAANKVVYFHE